MSRPARRATRGAPRRATRAPRAPTADPFSRPSAPCAPSTTVRGRAHASVTSLSRDARAASRRRHGRAADPWRGPGRRPGQRREQRAGGARSSSGISARILSFGRSVRSVVRWAHACDAEDREGLDRRWPWDNGCGRVLFREHQHHCLVLLGGRGVGVHSRERVRCEEGLRCSRRLGRLRVHGRWQRRWHRRCRRRGRCQRGRRWDCRCGRKSGRGRRHRRRRRWRCHWRCHWWDCWGRRWLRRLQEEPSLRHRVV